MVRKWHGIVLIVMTLLMSTFIQTSAAVAESGTGGAPAFTDIAKHWAKAQIEQAVAQGYVNGFPDGTFRPNKPVTVAEFLAMMFLSFTEIKEDGKRGWKDALILPLPEFTKSKFVDYGYEFDQGDPWYINHVINAKFLSIINDWEFEGRYEEPLTRERAAKIVNGMANWFEGPIHPEHAKLAALKLKDYTNFTPGWEAIAGESMVRGLLTGYSNSKFQPKKSITRAEAISVIERINKSEFRSPVKVDLSHVPYSMVWGGDGYPKFAYIFANWEMKKVYDQITSDIQYATGAIEQNGAAIYYFKDISTMKEGQYYRHHPELWYDNKIHIDMIISCASNAYNIQIAGIEDRFEQHFETLNRFLKSIFKNSRTEVYQLILESMKKHRINSLKEVSLIIENRQILIHSAAGGGDVLYIAISGYQDK